MQSKAMKQTTVAVGGSVLMEFIQSTMEAKRGLTVTGGPTRRGELSLLSTYFSSVCSRTSTGQPSAVPG